jgi:hypothetical protein
MSGFQLTCAAADDDGQRDDDVATVRDVLRVPQRGASLQARREGGVLRGGSRGEDGTGAGARAELSGRRSRRRWRCSGRGNGQFNQPAKWPRGGGPGGGGSSPGQADAIHRVPARGQRGLKPVRFAPVPTGATPRSSGTLKPGDPSSSVATAKEHGRRSPGGQRRGLARSKKGHGQRSIRPKT